MVDSDEPLRPPLGSATGLGSWPGLHPVDAARAIADLLPDLPHLPELPERGSAATGVARGAAVLVDLPAELDARGWRLGARSGADQRRAQALLAQDADAVEEVFEGYHGWFKIQLIGPITLVARLETSRGHRVLTDPGATRDVVDSLAEGMREWCATWARRIPGATLLVQLNEPLIDAALTGSLSTASGWGRVTPLEPQLAERALRVVAQAAADGAALTVVQASTSPQAIAAVRGSGAQGIGVASPALARSGESDDLLAEWVEAGALMFPACRVEKGADSRALIEPVESLWKRTGLDVRRIDQVVMTADLEHDDASHIDGPAAYRAVVDAGRRLRDSAEG